MPLVEAALSSSTYPLHFFHQIFWTAPAHSHSVCCSAQKSTDRLGRKSPKSRTKGSGEAVKTKKSAILPRFMEERDQLKQNYSLGDSQEGGHAFPGLAGGLQTAQVCRASDLLPTRAASSSETPSLQVISKCLSTTLKKCLSPTAIFPFTSKYTLCALL